MSGEIWDGYLANGSLAGVDLVRGEPVPAGLYHLVCEILVRHRDGDFLLMRRCLTKDGYPGFWEATAGGSALKGEDPLSCARRELREETGIGTGEFHFISRQISHGDSIFYSYLCETAWEKHAVTLQAGETMDFRWVNEAELKEFLRSDRIVDVQRERWMDYYRRMGYLE